MMHSSYFYGSMELQRDKGQRSLKNFFATAGIHPSDYKQVYSGMKMPTRRTLHQKFRDHGKSYGLTENGMFLQQFVRELGLLEERNTLFLHELSCSDAAYILAALLGSVPASLSGSRLDNLPQKDGHLDMEGVDELERQAMVDNFWRAFDAVLCKDPASLFDGISEAVEVAKNVQTMGRMLKESKAIHLAPARQFRYAKIEHPPHVFRHHLAVRRLAVWLSNTFFTYRPKGEAGELPLLLIVRDRVRDTYMLVGTAPSGNVVEMNEFGALFRTAIKSDSTIRYRYDAFDKSCIEVAADDFDRFWALLIETQS